MLRHAGNYNEADKIESCIRLVLSEGRVLTPDLGGTATTMQLADVIAKRVSS
jgi:isocitrate/isopropylmalate dehydrogenase